MKLREVVELVERWATESPETRGYGFVEQQRDGYDPAIEQSRSAWRQLLLELGRRGRQKTILQIGLGRHGGSHFSLGLFAERILSVEIDVSRIDAFERGGGLVEGHGHVLHGDAADAAVYQEVLHFAPTYDVLFLDGEASYTAIRRDWSNYAPLVRPGGLVVIADASADWPMSPIPSGVDVFTVDLRDDVLRPEGVALARWGSLRALHVYEQPAAPLNETALRDRPELGTVRCTPKATHSGYAFYESAGRWLACSGTPPFFSWRGVFEGDYDTVLTAEEPERLARLVASYETVRRELTDVRTELHDGTGQRGRARLAHWREAWPEFRADLGAALKLQPRSVSLRSCLGLLLLHSAEDASALQMLRSAVELDLKDEAGASFLQREYERRGLARSEGAALVDLYRRRVANMRHIERCAERRELHPVFQATGSLESVVEIVHVGAGGGRMLPHFAAVGVRRIHVFEPHPDHLEPLAESAERCRSAFEELVIEPFAIGERSERRNLFDLGDPEYASLLLPRSDTGHDQSHNGNVREHAVQVRRLDDVLPPRASRTEGRSALLIEAEGAELSVLRGASLRLGDFDAVGVALFPRPLHVGATWPEDVVRFLNECDDRGFRAESIVASPDGRRSFGVFVRRVWPRRPR